MIVYLFEGYGPILAFTPINDHPKPQLHTVTYHNNNQVVRKSYLQIWQQIIIWHLVQCDRIGNLCKFLAKTLYYKRSPNLSWLYGYFKNTTLKLLFGQLLSYFYFQHLVTLHDNINKKPLRIVWLSRARGVRKFITYQTHPLERIKNCILQ